LLCALSSSENHLRMLLVHIVLELLYLRLLRRQISWLKQWLTLMLNIFVISMLQLTYDHLLLNMLQSRQLNPKSDRPNVNGKDRPGTMYVLLKFFVFVTFLPF